MRSSLESTAGGSCGSRQVQTSQHDANLGQLWAYLVRRCTKLPPPVETVPSPEELSDTLKTQVRSGKRRSKIAQNSHAHPTQTHRPVSSQGVEPADPEWGFGTLEVLSVPSARRNTTPPATPLPTPDTIAKVEPPAPDGGRCTLEELQAPSVRSTTPPATPLPTANLRFKQHWAQVAAKYATLQQDLDRARKLSRDGLRQSYPPAKLSLKRSSQSDGALVARHTEGVVSSMLPQNFDDTRTRPGAIKTRNLARSSGAARSVSPTRREPNTAQPRLVGLRSQTPGVLPAARFSGITGLLRPISAPEHNKLPNLKEPRTAPAAWGVLRKLNKVKPPKKPVVVLSSTQHQQLRKALAAFDVDGDGHLDVDEMIEVRRALYGRGGVPIVAGDCRALLRKLKTRKLTPEQYTAQFSHELENMQSQQAAEDALWRLQEAAVKQFKHNKGWRKEVTQEDFDATWKRAEQLEERGEVRQASRMYETAREIHGIIRDGKVDSLAVADLDDFTSRRVKQDLLHVVLEQRQEGLEEKWTPPPIHSMSPKSTRELPRGWVEHVLPIEGGRRYYYGLKTGRSVWERPEPDDFSEDTLAPLKIQVQPDLLQSVFLEVAQEFKTPLVVDKADGPLVRALLSQKISFVSARTITEELRRELKKAMKFGFLIVFDARLRSGGLATEQFDLLCPDLLQMITCDRKGLQDQDFFELLEISSLEKRILGSGKIAPNFGLVWLQSDLKLPDWCTCETSVVIQAQPESAETLEAALNDLDPEDWEDVARPRRSASLSAIPEAESTQPLNDTVLRRGRFSI
eukprot:TRINITY_DN12858_c0_g1_i1.p1 TRINITY_DN12858_c0_g1~~TRINITY_DN12858_c0_g1_i1.p1  ORF type:complete len:798 (-),score=106.72 TRINITY_DN12858_c0_g1_i1:145-2538(-)